MRAKRLFQCDGEMVTVYDLADRVGISSGAVWRRLQLGWTPERIASTPKAKPQERRTGGKRYLFRGELRSVKEIAAATGLNRPTIRARIKDGRPLDAPLRYAVGKHGTARPRLLTYQGRTQLISAWAKEMGFHVSALMRRLDKMGWTVEQTLGTPRTNYGGHKHRTTVTKAGGWSSTSQTPVGTGPGRHEKHFDGDRP